MTSRIPDARCGGHRRPEPRRPRLFRERRCGWRRAMTRRPRPRGRRGAGGLVDDADLGEDEQGDGKRNDGRYVRHGAFHASAKRRKATERALEETKLGYARWKNG